MTSSKWIVLLAGIVLAIATPLLAGAQAQVFTQAVPLITTPYQCSISGFEDVSHFPDNVPACKCSGPVGGAVHLSKQLQCKQMLSEACRKNFFFVCPRKFGEDIGSCYCRMDVNKVRRKTSPAAQQPVGAGQTTAR